MEDSAKLLLWKKRGWSLFEVNVFNGIIMLAREIKADIGSSGEKGKLGFT